MLGIEQQCAERFAAYHDVGKIDPFMLQEAIKYGINIGIKLAVDAIGSIKPDTIKEIINDKSNTTA